MKTYLETYFDKDEWSLVFQMCLIVKENKVGIDERKRWNISTLDRKHCLLTYPHNRLSFAEVRS